jgi:hypothetical protein
LELNFVRIFNPKITLTFFAMFLLSSCSCYQTHLEEDEKAWCKPYIQGETIIFKGSDGTFDTIQVSKKEGFSNLDCNLRLGREQQNYINIDLIPKKCHNPEYCEGEIDIRKEVEEEINHPFFRIFGLEYDEGSELIEAIIKLETTGKTYTKAYYFEDKRNASNAGNEYMKSFYWDKQDGLIRYEAHNGEVFELLKVIK